MIIGVGTDIIEIERIRRACEKEAFLMRYFTIEERNLIMDNYSKAAGNFAVKEAVSKVFGTGFTGISLAEIEVLRDGSGKPYVNTYGRADVLRKELGIRYLHVSISNTRESVVAFAIGEG